MCRARLQPAETPAVPAWVWVLGMGMGYGFYTSLQARRQLAPPERH